MTTSYFSDLVVEFLHQQGIDKVAFNPGASFRGVHDSLVHADNAEIAPEIVMTCHEEIAVAVAHGYHKASGRHMGVFVHANVGLLHASMAVFNAWCDRVPLFVLGGNGPVDAGKRRPWIDWIHTSQNIESVVKDYVKWCDQPIGQRATVESLYRAFKLMNTPMQAPVFVALDFDVQEQPLEDGVRLLPARATEAARLPALNGADLDDLTGRLLAARLPVLVVDFSGRDPGTVAQLVALADALGLAVVDRGNRLNFPNTHQLNVSHTTGTLLSDADLVLALEVQDLVGALGSFLTLTDQGAPANGADIVTLGFNELLTSKWAADYQQFVPVTRAVAADTADSVAALRTVVEDPAGPFAAPEFTERREQRAKALADLHTEARAGWARQAEEAKGRDRIHVSAAVDEIHRAVRDEEWILTNTGSLTIDGWVKKLWPLERPGSYLGLNGGGGLGYGLGASIGAALAHQSDGTLCLDLQADGDFLYTPSALWTLAAYDVPLLVIVMNNRLYLNSTQHAERIAGNRDRDIDRAHIATSFYDRPVDFVTLARSFGVHTLPRVERVDAVAPTVREAVAHIKEHGKPVLVEILME
ncbi:thiamine pyrophosphate-binding protein [Streptomyces olivochromogenes]|uniref:Thiamine pyrophosphate-binding protein n=1 Tax=Streptomyces olivochromogenes TaxID=1963 RepID=A0A250VDD9_STROL|nr:thiamine pyrophosphate-dependent enzyme [Streptomyces olivochromogenes]KUN44585.1 thiamine pyrophosphate-binding protein [Streptomyces olivochromogenes]GAX52119.1 thiamine pyrophosphate-binding protein [Streptomyces olivochromogenes]